MKNNEAMVCMVAIAGTIAAYAIFKFYEPSADGNIFMGVLGIILVIAGYATGRGHEKLIKDAGEIAVDAATGQIARLPEDVKQLATDVRDEDFSELKQ